MNWKFWEKNKFKTYESIGIKANLEGNRLIAFVLYMQELYGQEYEEWVCKTFNIFERAMGWFYAREWFLASEEGKRILRRMKREGYAVNTRISLSIKELKI